jgi:nitrate/nitrite-specific signal transduction histidine kinase/PAS domain-containing protein
MSAALTDIFDVAPEQVFDYLFERLPVGTAIIDRDFRLLRCNPTWAEFIERYTPSTVADAVPGVSLFDLEPGTEEVIKPLYAPVFAGETVRQEGIRLESGGIVSYWDVVLVPLEANGKVVAALDVSLDATTHVLNQQALRSTLDALTESEMNLRSLLENAQGYAIYRLAVDPEHPYLGRVVLVSPSIRDVVGIDDPYDFRSWFRGLHPDDEERIVDANRLALEKGAPFDEMMRFYHPQREEWRWVHTVSNPIYDESGRLTHFNGITIDVTDQRRAQDMLAQINQVLEQQVADRTHEIQHRHQELQALYQADRELSRHLELDAVLQSLVDVAVDVLKADKSSLMVWDSAKERLIVRAAHGFRPETLRQMSFSRGEGSVGRVLVTGELAVVEDTRQDDRVITRITKAEGIRSFMHFPITVGESVFGVFNVDYTTPRSFRPEEQRLFMALAQRAGIAIEKAQLYREEQQRREESERRRQVAESLRETLSVLNSDRPLSEILNHIVAQASQLMGAALCTLHHIDYDEEFVRIEASYGLPVALRDIRGFPLLSTKADEQILRGEPVVISGELPNRPDPAADPTLHPLVRRWRATTGPRYPAYLAVPLIVSGEVYGSLAFYFSEPRSFGQDTVDLAVSLGEQAALAIANADLRRQAEQAAVASERNRLARELHDAVTQTLFSAGLIADVLPRIWERNPEVGREKLEELRELTRGALAEMRTLLLELRPATLTETSLDDLLQQLAAAVIGRSRLQVEVNVEGKAPVPPDTQVALYRIAQEALNNIVKHAGATSVTIGLRLAPDCVDLVVADDGRGFDPATVSASSLGLGIMRERAATIGADLQIESRVGEGTTVKVQACPSSKAPDSPLGEEQ